MWENLDKTRSDTAYYSVMRNANGVRGMDALRAMFPSAEADSLNFVLFATSGVHGTDNTIEDAERFMNGNDPDGFDEVTFLIVHSRIVALRYGVCTPSNQDDIDYLKRLRESSLEVVSRIGKQKPTDEADR